MNSQIENWCTRSWNILGQLPGNVGNALRSEWEAFQNTEQLSVTFFGPYDSGKSSLLKRLLVDSGQSIPDGLTVSARRETFELCEVQIEGLTVRDSPGIAGGNPVHQQVALEALLRSDVVVTVLPYQGMTSQKPLLLSIVDGSWFGCSPGFAYAPRGCAVVLCRMDEAGVNPNVSPREYRDLMDRKVSEMRSLLRDVDEGLISIHTVCADPGQLVGNAKPEGRHEYDAGREWDGVAQFLDFLKGLHGRKEDLRTRSEVRFIGFKMLELLEELRGMAATTEAGIKEWQHEAAANDLAMNRLTTHLTSAKADLAMYIEEEMASAARRGAADSTQFKADFLSALKSTYQRWATKHEAEIQKFLREADQDSQIRWERPSFEDVTKSWKDAPTKNDQAHHSSKDGSPPAPVSKIAKAVHKAFRELQEIRVGMPLGRAEEELRRLRSAGSFEKYLSQVKGASLLKDIKHAEIVENAVKLTRFLDVAVPVLIELGPLLGECLGDEIAARKRQAERERIRLQMAEDAANFEKETWRQWCEEGVPGAAVKSLNEQRRSAEELAEKLRLDLDGIKRTIEGLESLLLESGYKKGT